MQFLKKHYEKILLSVVLLALAATACWLFLAMDKKREEVSVQIPPLDQKKPLPALDLTPFEKPLERLKSLTTVDFSVPHHVINPVVWKQSADGRLFKIATQDLPRIVEIKPLYLVITYKRTSGTAGNVTGYTFGIERQAAARPPERKPVERYVSATGKRDCDLFILRAVQGPAESPTGFVLELNDTKKEVSVTPDQPFKRPDGYSADMRYEIENKNFSNIRIGDTISFSGETYKVIAINENEVTVRAISNEKQITIRKNAP